MATKHLLSGISILVGTNVLSAQAPAVLHSANTQKAELLHTVQLLEQNALLLLIGAVILVGLAWIAYLCHACVRLNKSKHSAHTHPSIKLLFVFGLSVLCCQCSPAYLTRAAEIQAAQAMEGRACLLSNHGSSMENAMMNYLDPTVHHYAWGYAFTCKYCGQRVTVRR